jgi:hypothetical protein
MVRKTSNIHNRPTRHNTVKDDDKLSFTLQWPLKCTTGGRMLRIAGESKTMSFNVSNGSRGSESTDTDLFKNINH